MQGKGTEGGWMGWGGGWGWVGVWYGGIGVWGRSMIVSLLFGEGVD